MSMSTKLIYIISDIHKSLAFEWIADQHDQSKFDLQFILLNSEPTPLEDFLVKKNIIVKRFPINSFVQKIKALSETYGYLKNVKPKIIHCHLFYASLIGLLAAKLVGIKKRIHTRHHSTYNHQYNRKGIYLDKLINYLSTDIVAISKNVQEILIEYENVPIQKIHLIHHGFDLEAFQNVDPKKVERLKSKYKITNGPVIGVIARWIEWKGIQYIIPAFKKLLKDYPEAILVLANANGPYKSRIEHLLTDLPKTSFRIITFEEDIFTLYHLFDFYVHTPIDSQIEAFGQTYVEALAAGIPSVFTLSGVAKEIIENRKNALVVPFMDCDTIYNSILELLKIETHTSSLIKIGKDSLRPFLLSNMIHNLHQLYDE